MRHVIIWSLVCIASSFAYQYLQVTPQWSVAAERSWFEVWTTVFFYWYLKTQGKINVEA